ncbi:LacI family DNA-binding transcriptional regulator [Lederbergia lenta]|uniref:LacI family DNA-binding transcriptional regulator n=1 Tax=Lederbergia lenta TaxID=1467 RepID=UPI0020415CEA|nr:LacI family DNA-binding transcriptional regulator [Lederbergia lenta]MCM3110981.1 LacI family transcriptional regulator [Lederbergia lenta]
MNSTEIAKLAGVSRSTVSRVINNYPNVPAATRKKVMSIIQENNYYPNLSAQVLAGKKTGTIGLFVIERGQVSSDSLSNFLIMNIIESATSMGYYVLTNIIRDTNNYKTIESIKEVFFQRRVDGGIFIGANNYEPLIEELIKEGFIIGIVDQDMPGANEPNRIVTNFDNEHGAMKAIDYLVSLNHQNIGIINGNMNRIAGPKKFQGFMKSLKKHGLNVNEDWVLDGDFSKNSGYMAIDRLIKKNIALPTAIFAANDSTAFGAITAFSEHSISVPDDISIIGFDDHMLSAYVKPGLTTLKVDFIEMMKSLTTNVIHAIEGRDVEVSKFMIGAELVIRESCRRIG